MSLPTPNRPEPETVEIGAANKRAFFNGSKHRRHSLCYRPYSDEFHLLRAYF